MVRAFVNVILGFLQNLPAEGETMNYASMIFVGLLALACTYWFYRRSHSTPYQGPGSKAGLIVAVSESHSE